MDIENSGYKRRRLTEVNIYMTVYMFIWVIILVFLMWKARFGAASYDESLYLTIPYRLQQGDAMIWDEWNLSQMSSLLTIPFVSVFRLISGGTEGITIAYRYYSVIIWSLVSFILYLRMRKYLKDYDHGEPAAIMGSAVFMIYAPFGMMVLSYNTYALLALMLACIVLLPDKPEDTVGHKRWIAAGFFYAYSVLCSPHILIIWALSFVYAVIRKKFRYFLDFTLGAACLAMILAIYVLGRVSIKQILAAIPVMLSDPYHQQVSAVGYIKDYFFQVLFWIPGGVWVYICFGILIAVVLADRRRKERRRIYFSAACLLTILLLILTWMFNRYINSFIYPVNILAMVCIFIEPKRIKEPAFMCLWIPGMLYSFCINMSSNQYFLAISSASIIALAGSILIIWKFAEDTEEGGIRHRFPVRLYYAVLIILIAFIGILRYSFVFQDSDISKETQYIDRGPQKGIRASIEDKEVYDGILSDLQCVREYEPDKVLFFTRDNWPYLAGTWRCGAFSPWLQNEIDDYAVSMLMEYYTLDETRKPDVIYIDKKYSRYGDSLAGRLDYDIVKTLPSGNMLAVPAGRNR